MQSDLSYQRMEAIGAKIGTRDISLTTASHKSHVEFVQSVKDRDRRSRTDMTGTSPS